MGNIQTVLMVVCGGALICVTLLGLLMLSFLRLAGRPGVAGIIGLAPLALRFLEGRGQGDREEDQREYVPRRRAQVSAESLRAQAQSLDFDSAVAQKLNQQPGFTTQNAPPTYPGQPPAPYTPTSSPNPSFGAPPFPGVPQKTMPSSTIPSAPAFPSQSFGPPSIGNVPPVIPPSDFGPTKGLRADTLSDYSQPLDNTVSNSGDALGPFTAPSLRNRPQNLPKRSSPTRPRSTAKRDANAGDDELFGGLLDGDGDGFADL
ncbi:MAG: hypothetical protein H7Y09_03400 [Chitinophagaceae bacterium]|nr:hypothetical protein [Anaerolineae bacterium]